MTPAEDAILNLHSNTGSQIGSLSFLVLVVSNELTFVSANRIQDQAHTNAETIDKHIFLADVSHLLPQVLILLEHP